MVGQAGLEPAVRNAPDLQSGGVTNFPTDPYIISSKGRSLFKPAHLTHLVSGLRPAGYANSLRDIKCLVLYMSDLNLNNLPV